MLATLARIAWIALLVAAFSSRAQAAEVPDSSFDLAPPRDATQGACTGSRIAYGMSVPIGLAGPVLMFGGVVQAFGSAMSGGDPNAGLGFMVVGAASSVTGLLLTVGSTWANTACTRGRGIDVSNGLAIAATTVPLALGGAAFAFSIAAPDAAWGLAIAAYLSPFALGGAQIGLNTRRLRHPFRGVRLGATRIGETPAVLVAGVF